MLQRQQLSHRERRERLFYLAIAFIPVLGSFALSHGLSLNLPGCPLMKWVGVPCPGWGLTRSFLSIAQGDWPQAIAFHAFGPVIALGFCWAIIHLSMELVRDRKIPFVLGPRLKQPRVQIGCFLVLLGYHSVRLYGLWQTGQLLHSFSHSPLGHWWGA